jgi:hypothetical protein
VKPTYRAFLAAGLLAALVLAGVVSFYASNSPDGLMKVAGDKGFLGSAEPHHADGSPLAGYGTKGVDDARLSGGVAGVAGVGLTLLIGGGLFLAIRRKGTAANTTATDTGAGDGDAGGSAATGSGAVTGASDGDAAVTTDTATSGASGGVAPARERD